MKKFLSLLLSLLLVFCLAACGAEPTPTADKPDDTIEETATSENTDKEETDSLLTERLADIHVSQRVDEMTSTSTVTIENNGDYCFSASVHVTFKDSANKIVGADTIFVEDLSAGQDTYAKIALNSIDVQNFEYDFGSDVEFTEIESANAEAKDDDLSKKLAEEFEGSFGGAGRPEFATSWYKFVEDMAVYTSDNGGCAVITVNTDQQEDIDRIGNTVFANYVIGDTEDEFPFDSVKVINSDGVEVFFRAK